MQFYRIEGIIQDEEWIRKMDDRCASSAKTRKISGKIQKFNARMQKKAFYFVSDDSDDLITIGVIYQKPEKDREEQLACFQREIGMELESLRFEDVILRVLKELVGTVGKKKYIDDDKTLLE